MGVRNGWWRRVWGWCASAARETARGWRGAVALILRDPWRPLALVALFYFLPSFAGAEVAKARALLDLIARFVCLPLLCAALARVQWTAMRGGSAPLVDTVRGCARQWRELLMLALFCTMLERAGAFVASTVSELLIGLISLVTWIPLLGTALSAVFFVLITLIGLFVSFSMGQGVYFVWLARESERAPVLLTLPAAWKFVKEHAGAVVGLYACLSVVFGALILLSGNGLHFRWLTAAADALCWLLGASYAAALYADGTGARVRDPHFAPANLRNMKRANIPEE